MHTHARGIALATAGTHFQTLCVRFRRLKKCACHVRVYHIYVLSSNLLFFLWLLGNYDVIYEALMQKFKAPF